MVDFVVTIVIQAAVVSLLQAGQPNADSGLYEKARVQLQEAMSKIGFQASGCNLFRAR